MDNGFDDIRASVELLELLNLDESYNHQSIDEFLKLVHPDDLEHFKQAFSQLLTRNLPYQIEHRLIRPDGVEMYVHQQTEIVYDAHGNPVGILGTLQDISELKSARELINHQRHYDSLTDLPKRKKFQERARKMIEHPMQKGKLFATTLVSIDKIKHINETLGHDVVDEVLIAYAQRLKTIRIGDIYISHHHDDTFALLASGLEDFNQVNELVQEIMAINKLPVWIGESELHIQCSIGLSLYPLDNDDFNTILKGAENALNRARANGGNQAVFYSEEMNRKAHNRLEIEQDMRKGLERGEFVVYYQPQIDTRTGKVSGMEALVRWQHPEKGLIPPFDFIPVAEETGLIKQLGDFVLRDACAQTKRWNDASIGRLRVAVNLSPLQMLDADFHDAVISILDESQLSPSLLDLEITESMAVHDMDNVITILGKFREKGITISIDDFGTGYSALSYLRQLPLNIIKIDRSFVKDIGEGDDGSIAKAVMAMSHSLGMSVIAEGVETEVQLNFMLANNCEEIQGFYYSPPLPAAEFEAFVIRHNGQTGTAAG